MTLPRSEGDSETLALEQEIEAEMAFHLDALIEDERMAGASDAEARRRARERFGDPDAWRRRARSEALKERIMLQRINTAILGVLVLAIGGLFVQLTIAQRNQAAAIERIRAELASDTQHGSPEIGIDQPSRPEMVSLVGGLHGPASYEIPKGGMTLRGLLDRSMAFVGGATDVRVTRMEPDGSARVVLDVAKERFRKPSWDDFRLQSGDLVKAYSVPVRQLDRQPNGSEEPGA